MIVIIGLSGLIVLLLGADFLVRGASRLAVAAHIPPLVIGLTIVGFGTSSPELVVSLQSALQGQADIAVGNAIGSNIFNVLLILGASALITPLATSRKLVRLEVPVMIAVAFLFTFLVLDGAISRGDGFLLFFLLLVYLAFQFWQNQTEGTMNRSDQRSRPVFRQALLDIALVVIGLIMLIIGSRWLVDGAVALATALGVSRLIIGITVIAAGTGMPEAATSIVATLRGERDIAVGNVVGSNIFNLLCVLGLTGIVAPHGLKIPPAALSFDIPVMLAVSVACLPVFFRGYEIARWEGAIFLLYYISYLFYLLLDATQHDALPLFSRIMWLFVLPLTVITFLVLAVRSARSVKES